VYCKIFLSKCEKPAQFSPNCYVHTIHTLLQQWRSFIFPLIPSGDRCKFCIVRCLLSMPTRGISLRTSSFLQQQGRGISSVGSLKPLPQIPAIVSLSATETRLVSKDMHRTLVLNYVQRLWYELFLQIEAAMLAPQI